MGELWMVLLAALIVVGAAIWRRMAGRKAVVQDDETGLAGSTSLMPAVTPGHESQPPVTLAEDDDLADAEAELMRVAAEAERLAAEQTELARQATEREALAARERLAAARAEAERQAAAQAELERQAAERDAEIERQRLAAAQVEADRLAAEFAEAERQAAEQAELARQAAEREAEIERQRLAAAQLETERLAAARAEAERQAAEQAELARQAAEREAEIERERLAAARAEAELAAVRAEAEQAAAAHAAAQLALAAASTKSPAQSLVLVADDSKVVRIKTGRLLTAHQYQVCYANDGLDAVQQLQAQRPDVVITDVEMPGMDGFELTRHIRAQAATADIPVIMITAADERHRDEAAMAGVSVLLGKPYPEDELIAHLRRALGQAEAVADALA